MSTKYTNNVCLFIINNIIIKVIFKFDGEKSTYLFRFLFK